MEQLESLFEKLTKNTTFLIGYNDAKPHHKVTINSPIKEQIESYLQCDTRKFWQFEDFVFDVSQLSSKLTFRHLGMIPSFLQNESIIKLKSVDPIFTIIVNHDDKTLFQFEHFLHPVYADCTTVKKLVYNELSNRKTTNYTVESVTTSNKKIWDEKYSLSELRVWNSPKIIYVNLKTVIYPAKKNPDNISIVIQMYTGKIISLDINPNDNLEILFEILNKEDISEYRHRLILDGKCLYRPEKASSYNIREGTVIFIVTGCPDRRSFNWLDPALLLNPSYCSDYHKRMQMSLKDYKLLEEINETLEEGSVEKNLSELLLDSWHIISKYRF
jgi:hypothetical protein